MDLLVVGAGAMGRWFGQTVDCTLAFTDVDSDAAERAADALGARSVPLDGDEQFDLVCLAVPMGYAAEAVEMHAHRAVGGMCDVTGSMATPLDAMRTHLPDRERFSLHPLFAARNSPGNVAVVADSPGPLTTDVLDSLDHAGNTVFETTVEEHDDAMETVQAAAHAAVLSFGLAAEDVRDEFSTPVSSALDALVETVSAGTPRVYADIQATFGDGSNRVADAARDIAEADPERFADLYRQVAETAGGPATDRPEDGHASDRDH
ncbi:prephenate dehydrogenase [Haloferax namakaokahaiae]|uniref:Prephenate dehydrogenase n=1 Tax=Haloferax namakaokahaiae TaxID=1748331 RepID=A0ABD5ZF17_9EURY